MGKNGRFFWHWIVMLALGAGIGAGIEAGIHGEKADAAMKTQYGRAKPEYLAADMWERARIPEAEYHAMRMALQRAAFTAGPLYVDRGINVVFERDYVYVTVLVNSIAYDAQGRDWRSPEHMAVNKMTAAELEKSYESVCGQVAKRISEELHVPVAKIRIFWQSRDYSSDVSGAVDEGFYVDGRFSVSRLADKDQGVELPKWVEHLLSAW